MAGRRKVAPKATSVATPRLSNGAFFGILGAVTFVVIGGSIYAGTRDSGQINISGTLREAAENREVSGEASGAPASIPNEALRSMPNGGLVPTDTPVPPPTPEPIVATDATTTSESETTPSLDESVSTDEAASEEVPDPSATSDETLEVI